MVYEKGIYHMGRFVRWGEMEDIKIDESSIRVEIKDSFLGMLMMRKVSRTCELIRLIKEGNFIGIQNWKK
ncbi:hypothetical protein CLFO_16670 [Clostridium formicaceticum]|uniref:Uncharacterized protein n=1 Tax=Clostridium formicaceticum TaxID=1497 RepID=A0AAC9WFX4_9CLOT|nr:hypothetical protein CLFO_16670 [Clostridium formicaceticum]